MPTYCGIGGVVRKLKEWPVGVGGIVKQQKEVWAAENGVSKKIFSAEKQFSVRIQNYNSNAGDAFDMYAIAKINGVNYTFTDDGTVLSVKEGTTIACKASSGGVYVNGSFFPGSGSNEYLYTVSSDVTVLITVQVTSLPETFIIVGTIRINT